MWETEKLGEVCKVRRGTTITKKNTIKGNIPVIGGGTKPTYFHNEANRVANCITISGSGANAGYVNLWDIPIFASDCSTVEDKNGRNLQKFIFYFLKSKQKFIYENFRSGAAQPHVYAKDIAQLDFPIVPLIEQQRIVTKLDTVFDEIDKVMKLVDTKIAKIEALKISLINKLIRDMNLKSKTRKLGEVCDFVRGPFGSSLKKNIFVNEGYAVYEQQHPINNQCKKFRYFVTSKKYGEMSRFQVRKGDILMSCSGTIGKTTIVPHDAPLGIINQALLKISPHKILNVRYLHYYMSSEMFTQQLMNTVDGVAIQNVASVRILKEIQILIPSQNEQQKIVEKLDLAIKEYLSAKSKISKIKKNYQSLKSAILSQELQKQTA
ncbi:MAG: restriction endonuclease subunit S [Gammaproteobacteria bacterium]|nr:restriction endonuclease subunit S [Gammaproteobacteria bacterium]